MFGVGVAGVLGDISTLPALTHLCLDCDFSREIVLPVLANCPRLQHPLVQWPLFDKVLYNAARIPCVYDVHFIIEIYDDYWSEWENGARGHLNSWTQADEFLVRKRNGEIEGILWDPLMFASRF
jgi:hypothetical protein